MLLFVPSQLTYSHSEYVVLVTIGNSHRFTFVPVFLGRPNEENQSPPLLQMAWGVTMKINEIIKFNICTER